MEIGETPGEPCFYATRLRGSRIVALGLPVLRDWHECGHPRVPLGDFVCPCAGCDPTCPGYIAESAGPTLPPGG